MNAPATDPSARPKVVPLPRVEAPTVDALYRATPQAAPLAVRARGVNGQILVSASGPGTSLDLNLRAADLAWPRRRGPDRVMTLPGGATLQAQDAAAWDAWARQVGPGAFWHALHRAGWAGLAAAVLAAAALWASYAHGLPWIARGVVAMVPAKVDTELGRTSLREMDAEQLAPSQLDATTQQRWREAFAAAVRKAEAAGQAPVAYELQFRRSRDGEHPGPNAFALPGGTIVVTDELVALLQGQDDALLGVLGHELGHVRERHGMRMVAQTGLLGLAAAALLGDVSTVLAGAPVLLGQAAYSREAEREADDAAIALLQANGKSPLALITLFERLAERRAAQARPAEGSASAPAGEPAAADAGWGIALASHPADAERIARIRAAAARP